MVIGKAIAGGIPIGAYGVTEELAGRILGDPDADLVDQGGIGGTLRYRAFPRLELLGTALGQSQGDNLGGQGTVRATLALDDAFEGTLGLEARRVEIGSSRWSGARGIVSMPLPRSFRLGTEIELVIPDEPNGRGSVWPWVLGALGYRPKPGWDALC
jgi:hypothetical protein